MSRHKSSKLTYDFGGVNVFEYIRTNNARIENVGRPSKDNDAATKKYVDDNITSSEIYTGSGLNKVGTTFSVNSNLSHVTGLGNINTGTWSANAITVPYGGTGKTSFTANKIVMGDGANPLVSISELSFESNRLQSSAPLYITNNATSTGIGSGGSLTVLGGASISGKVWMGNELNVANNVNISGDVTLGNLKILGTSNFGSVSANDGSYTNSTITNLLNTNITSSNIITSNIKTTNLTTSNCISTNITNTNILTSNISASTLQITNNINATHLSIVNITTSSLITTRVTAINTTTTNLVLTNVSGSSAVLSNLNVISNITTPNLLSSSIISNNINATNGTLTSITSENLIINTSTILNTNVTTQNLWNINFTSSNIQSTNIRTTNITSSNITTTNINATNSNFSNVTSTNILNTNFTTSNIVATNISTSNITTTNILLQNITTATLRVSGISIQTTINSISISTGNLSVTGTTNLTNTIMTNTTVPNIFNTNITTTNLNTNNITTSNLYVNTIATLGTVGSSNLSTGNIHSSSTVIFNNEIANTSTISNLRVTNISVLGTVNSNNLSTGSIHVSTNLVVPLINNTTQTTTNLLVASVRATNISTSSLQVTGTSIFTTVTSNNLLTGNLVVSNTSNLTNIIGSNITVPNIVTTSITSSNIIVSNNVSIRKSLNIGSNFSAPPNTTSGNILNIVPSIFTDNTTTTGGIVPFWATNFFANSTLSAQNPITTQRVCSMYLQGDPIVGINQTIQNSTALAIGHVNNQLGGNLNGQIILERNDGNWYGSIFTESSTNRIVIANASLSGGGGIGLYTYTGTKITFADIPSATNVTPTAFIQFSNNTSTFYSQTESISKTSGSVILQGGLGVSKNITCESITPTSIIASIKSLEDVDLIMNPSPGQSLVWNGTKWSAATITGGGGGGGVITGSTGPTPVEIYAMNLVMPIMTSNGPVNGNDGDYYVSASSEWSSSYAAYKCLSNITNPTDWATSGENTDFWIKVQLPSSQEVRYVLLEGRINNEDPLSVTIQGSNDDSTYTDIITDQAFTALNYNGYFSARIPDDSKDYTFYKFLFPTGFGINPGLNMLRLFKYDNTTYTEGILDNSSVEGNGKFNGSIINGRWPMAFKLIDTTIVNIRAQITCYTSSSFVLRRFVMYINGSPFQNDGSTFIKQTVHQNLHTSLQTLEWTGSLPSGTHTISFFVDGGAGIIFDINDNIRVNIVKY
jgi:uncharacterized protein YjbI with pentapeptide repeats